MKHISLIAFCLVLALSSMAQDKDSGNLVKRAFWLGADLSGTTMIEQHGTQLYNAQGEPRDNFTLQKELGMQAVRLRIWVNPQGGWCSKEDALVMAKRAQALNMPVMVSFHYSDTWADPGKQSIPEAWKDYDYEQMKQAVSQHTIETLQLFKDNNIDVRWVNIGNETPHGMLWPMGRAEENMEQYAGLTEAGCLAVKKVYPNALTIIHLDSGCDPKRYNFIFDGLRQYGVHWDMIGMSCYPHWDVENHLETTDEGTLTDCIDNINALSEKYGCDVMIVETGYDADRAEDGYRFMKSLIAAASQQTNGHCKGIFYWATELEGPYKLGAFRNHRPTKIMDAFTEYTKTR